jgi:hypothetical protein
MCFAGSESRRFIAVPEGATWAELRTFAGDHPTPRVSSTAMLYRVWSGQQTQLIADELSICDEV